MLFLNPYFSIKKTCSTKTSSLIRMSDISNMLLKIDLGFPRLRGTKRTSFKQRWESEYTQGTNIISVLRINETFCFHTCTHTCTRVLKFCVSVIADWLLLIRDSARNLNSNSSEKNLKSENSIQLVSHLCLNLRQISNLTWLRVQPFLPPNTDLSGLSHRK